MLLNHQNGTVACNVVVFDSRMILEQLGVWDRGRRLGNGAEGRKAIPIQQRKSQDSLKEELLRKFPFSFEITICNLSASKVAKLKTPREDLESTIVRISQENNTDEAEIGRLLGELPNSWEKHGDLVLFPIQAFVSSKWRTLGDDLWLNVAEVLSCHRLAKKTNVITDDFRTPQVELLLGDNGWVKHVDNGITYSYDVTRCMFSAGNITEKMRVANLDCRNEAIVDLYAGIGYFTLPYLVHARAAHVHACEWNPNAVEALRRNLEQNGVSHKATVYEGDNREVCPKNVADRVNLGLIPTSELGWPVACAALKRDKGGILHIHDNVSSFKETNANSNSTPSASPGELSEQNSDLVSNTAAPSGVDSNCDSSNCDITPSTGSSGDSKHSSQNIKAEWLTWGQYAQAKIRTLLQETWHMPWRVEILHIEHVKSYAPHVDHIVLDLSCKPVKQ